MDNKSKCEVIPSRKEEFKLVKKVLRKHGCLRAYRRFIRLAISSSVFDYFNFCKANFPNIDYPFGVNYLENHPKSYYSITLLNKLRECTIEFKEAMSDKRLGK